MVFFLIFLSLHLESQMVFTWMPLPISSADTEAEQDRIVAMQHLLVAADRYGLDRLRLMCEEKLCSWLDVQSVATTLALTEQHQCVQLRDICLRFIDCRYCPYHLRWLHMDASAHIICRY